MQQTPVLEGVIPVLLTPLDRGGNVDKSGLAALIEHLLEKEVGGFWILGTGGEDMALTYQQRLEVAQVSAEVIGGTVPTILGAGFFALKDTRDFMRDTANLKIDGYHVLPYHPLISLDRIEWLYKHLANQAPKPLWMYTSANWSRYIPADFIQKLKDTPNIAGIKFSTSNIVEIEKALSFTTPDFQVITAVVRQFFSSLCLGARAGTTVEACPFPDPIIDIYKRFRSGDVEGAKVAQSMFNRLLEKMPKEPAKDNFLRVAEAKYVLSKKGICNPYVSGYYRHLNSKEKHQIDQILDEVSDPT